MTSPIRSSLPPQHHCRSCTAPFRFFRRRYRCAVCFLEFCGQCTVQSRLTAEYATSNAVVVCRSCSTDSGACWAPDHTADTCKLCGNAFTLLNRRHHCRRCGQIFCAKCTNSKMKMRCSNGNSTTRANNSLGVTGELERVCDMCKKLAPLYIPSMEESQRSWHDEFTLDGSSLQSTPREVREDSESGGGVAKSPAGSNSMNSTKLLEKLPERSRNRTDSTFSTLTLEDE
eukprot:PhF_6_TR11158/c0_g1_i1/m.17984